MDNTNPTLSSLLTACLDGDTEALRLLREDEEFQSSVAPLCIQQRKQLQHYCAVLDQQCAAQQVSKDPLI
ncbi:hypothetical protein [Candidatus Igneacidithiobacillus taiwanensis]|uniref:hypothetical protein n=1 Tax=Candidatus Igneacidithiobacillus taiwanensis TaxID=1945924 RepID=UPI00289CC85A|nr:hypothetical protein [Candidatus Igneacidithiobacillus taiwanensis]